jgi:hypothetical protein
LGRIWFSNTIAGLARLSRPRGAEMRQQPCTVRAGDGYKVRHCKGEVLITLVLVLDIMPLAIIHAVIYIYIADDLKLGVLLAGLSWVDIYRGLIVLAVFLFLGVERWFSFLKSLLYLLHILAY